MENKDENESDFPSIDDLEYWIQLKLMENKKHVDTNITGPLIDRLDEITKALNLYLTSYARKLIDDNLSIKSEQLMGGLLEEVIQEYLDKWMGMIPKRSAKPITLRKLPHA